MAQQSGNILDIGRQQIGSVYGKALLAVTEKSSTTAAVLYEFESVVSDVLAELPDFDAVLSSPRVPNDEKIRILDAAFESRMSEQLLTFLKVVCSHDRLDCLREIYIAARHLHNENLGLIEVKVTSANTISSDLKGNIETTLRDVLHSEIMVAYQVDPNLIGGMVVRAGDTVFDGSVVNHLEQLRIEALERSFQATIGVLDRFMSKE